MSKPAAAKEFQRLMLLNGATISPPDPRLYGYEDRCLFEHWKEP